MEAFVVALIALLPACAGSAMVQAAHAGDRPALARELTAAGGHGTFALGDAADVAHAVVAHEIGTAPSPDVAIARIHEARTCAIAIDDVLADRMEAGDAVAGEAALVRVEAGALGESSARDHVGSTDDSWRAVAMWGMTRSGDHEARLHGLTDGSPLVRRAALRAIVERNDGTEWSAVFETARLDPEPLVRAAAIRSLARLRGAPSDVAIRLRDLWVGADDGLRDVLAGVFSSPGIVDVGGKEALTHLLSTSSGNRAVTIAGVIAGGRVEDVPLRAAATAVLVAAIKEGVHRVRLHAIAVAPVHGGTGSTDEAKLVIDALQAASRAEDLDVRVAALGRLAGLPGRLPTAERDRVVQELEALAAPNEDTTYAARSSTARLLLAEAGDTRVQAWLEQDLISKDPFARISAAEALAALGRAARAAPLLADEDASVRTRAACTMLLAAHLRKP